MGIKVRNLDEVVLHFNVAGTLTTGSIAVNVVPFAGFISNIFAKLGTAGTGVTATKLDINKNGTTIYAATTTQITLAATTGTVTTGAYTVDPTVVAAGDILDLDVDAISTAPGDLCVSVLISRRNPRATTHIADLTTV